jgi:hypothetical protein
LKIPFRAQPASSYRQSLLFASAKKPQSAKCRFEAKIYPTTQPARDVDSNGSNQIWCADVPYIPTGRGLPLLGGIVRSACGALVMDTVEENFSCGRFASESTELLIKKRRQPDRRRPRERPAWCPPGFYCFSNPTRPPANPNQCARGGSPRRARSPPAQEGR